MKTTLLRKHLESYLAKQLKEPKIFQAEAEERRQRIAYYQSWDAGRISQMTEEKAYEYLAKLWAMAMWGNKEFVVNKILDQNGLPKFRQQLADLLWGKASLAKRWNTFRKEIKSVGPAMMSELLCHVHPDTCLLWNRRTHVGLDRLGATDLPTYDYQLTGEKYEYLCSLGQEIAQEARKVVAGTDVVDLFWVDYFIWKELQVADTFMPLEKSPAAATVDFEKLDKQSSEFIHNDIRDKLADIGRWLGFNSDIEKKVAAGSKVDTIWEATIGNMGRVIYVFEVQTKGSIDSLNVNLLKSLKNPAVQGVVAVSDKDQLEKIKKHAIGMGNLPDKLKTWDYEEVLKVHESLSAVNESINKLGLVPQGF